MARQWNVMIVAGPTASGKSALALRLADACGGEIVNADALQIYSDLAILTARPSDAEMARVPHHLFGIAPGEEAWSAGRWLRAARETLDQIRDRNRPAVVVGGSGLYLRALTEGLADIPAIPLAVRSEVRALFDSLGEAAFRERLAQADPAAAGRIAAGDRQRLTRAMEVHRATGRPLSHWRGAAHEGLAPGSWRALVIDPPRDRLYAACDARLARMISQGALEEVARLAARGLPGHLPIMKAVGLRPLLAHLAGTCDLGAALASAQQETRRYAKRQLTWLRGQCPDWPRLDDPEDFLPHISP